MDRRLSGVQTQMDDMQRRLAGGATPPSRDLSRLTRSLDRIAPVLLALEAQVGAAQLSPHLRQLLHRVRTRLGDTHASAAALAEALRRSGAQGPEVWLLLRKLEQFQSLTPALVPDTAPALPSTAPTQGFTQNYATATPASPALPAQHAAAQQGRATPERATPSQSPAAPSGAENHASVSGSASAGPGGALSVAGLGALAALLTALVLPRLLSRVELPPMRRYAATFLAVLERPG
jgi:hypothetical protein